MRLESRGVLRHVLCHPVEDDPNTASSVTGAVPALWTWIDIRSVVVPEEFLDRLDTAVPFDPESLVDKAEEAMVASLDPSGSETHAGAFDLLEADALITYACQALLKAENAPEGLRRLATRLSGGG